MIKFYTIDIVSDCEKHKFSMEVKAEGQNPAVESALFMMPDEFCV